MSDDHPDALVILTRVLDPVRAELIRELLESHGIPASVPGSQHRGMLGIEGAFLELPILVPRRFLGEAEELLEAIDSRQILGGDGADGGDDDDAPVAGSAPADLGGRHPEPAKSPGRDGPYRAELPARLAPSPRLRRVSGFVAIAITFGAGHWYARETRTAAVLTIAQALALVVSMTVHPWAMLVAVGLVLYDFFGSMAACRRVNERRALGPRQQTWRGLLAVCGACAVAVLLVPVASHVERREREAAAQRAREERERLGLPAVPEAGFGTLAPGDVPDPQPHGRPYDPLHLDVPFPIAPEPQEAR